MADPVGISRHGEREIGASRPRNQQDRDLDYSSSEFHLFGNAERVLDLDPEIADRASSFVWPSRS